MTDARHEHGFTLVEVLVALLILALASGAAFQAISGGTAELCKSRSEREALTLAETILAQMGHVMALIPGHLVGKAGGFDWTADIGNALADPPPAVGLAAYPVHVAVRRHDERGSQVLRLDSVRLGPQPVSP